MTDLTHRSLESALASLRKSGTPLKLYANCPVGTEKVINGKRYRLIEDGPGAAKIMRVLKDGTLEDL